MITVQMFADLQSLFGGREVRVPIDRAPDIGRLLATVCDSPRREQALFAETGDLRKEIVILVNGRNVRFLEGQRTLLRDGDQVAIFPPVFGG